MKAEQRKELETNTLADRMGRLVQDMKGQSRRNMLYWTLAGVGIVIALFLVFRWYQTRRANESLRWLTFDDGSRRSLEILVKAETETNAGKAARFEYAWVLFWHEGVRNLANSQGNSIKSLEVAAAQYRQLAKECENDPVWEPEALFALAAIEETKALLDPDRLKTAELMYKDVVSKHPKSAQGELAAKWLEEKFDSKGGRTEMQDFYADMKNALGIRPPINDSDLQRILKGGAKGEQPSKKK